MWLRTRSIRHRGPSARTPRTTIPESRESKGDSTRRNAATCDNSAFCRYGPRRNGNPCANMTHIGDPLQQGCAARGSPGAVRDAGRRYRHGGGAVGRGRGRRQIEEATDGPRGKADNGDMPRRALRVGDGSGACSPCWRRWCSPVAPRATRSGRRGPMTASTSPRRERWPPESPKRGTRAVTNSSP